MIPVVLLACSEEKEPTPYTYTQVFTGTTSKAWTVSTIRLKEEGKADQVFSLPPCLADDRYVFYANTDRLYEITEGSTRCSANDPDLILSDSWSFNNANATLNIVFPLLADGRLPFIVREATNSEITLEIFFNDNKSSYRILFRYANAEK